MKKIILSIGLVSLFMTSCELDDNKPTELNAIVESNSFNYLVDKFADLQVLRYQVTSWEKLSLKQKKYAYYLTQAGYAGRDIYWDQNYRYNLQIRKALEFIYVNYTGDKSTNEWASFEVYLKRIWFSNGIHHHYSMDKIIPEFSRLYFEELLENTSTQLSSDIIEVIFNPAIDAKKVSLDPAKDLVLNSAVNFYGPNVTEEDVTSYYENLSKDKSLTPISYGLNTKLIKEDGVVKEQVWKLDGLYSEAIKNIIYWLKKASEVTENVEQKEALELLISYYKTGDLKTWDAYNIKWLSATEGDIDYINAFVEVYNDPKGYKGSYQNIVEINDFEMTEKMAVLANNAQWFEDNSSIMNEHKKESVVGVSYKVVNTVGESGDASPSTPIGVNLPNAEWIRAKHGSKSVSLGNIVQAYNNAGGSAMLEEFVNDNEELERVKKYGKIGAKLHTAMHEVIGHASGKLNEGVGTPKETLKNYASALEEARADLVALYYLYDDKLIELGLMPSKEVGKAEYDTYLRNGLMTQLIRVEPGQVIEEAHMRNRQLVASWVLEKGKSDNVAEFVKRDGKTYVNINDYDKLRILFGQLLREIQRIKSEGDYEAGKALIETYGVQINEELHKEVLERSEKLNIPPYSGFVNPKLVPLMENMEIKDVKIDYTQSFTDQMLEYSSEFGFLD